VELKGSLQPPLPFPSQINPVYASHPISWWTTLILFSPLHLGLQSGLFHSSFPTKTVQASFLSLLHATCLTHFILLDFIIRTIFGEEYRSLRFSLCSFLYSLVTSSLLGPNILLSTLFSKALSLCSSLTVSDHVTNPYKQGLQRDEIKKDRWE